MLGRSPVAATEPDDRHESAAGHRPSTRLVARRVTVLPTPSSEPCHASPHLLVRAARGEAVERPPVWAMRQAGRWDPEFNRVRAGLGFYEFSEDVERAAARLALPAPVRRGRDHPLLRHHHPAVAMGLPFELEAGAGPVPDRPIRTAADLDRLEPGAGPGELRPHPRAAEAGEGGVAAASCR